jgi:hypothetical protein
MHRFYLPSNFDQKISAERKWLVESTKTAETAPRKKKV